MYKFKIDYRNPGDTRSRKITIKAANQWDALAAFKIKKPGCLAFSWEELPQY